MTSRTSPRSSRSCTFFMLLKATRHWNELDTAAQREVFDDALSVVFNGYPELRMSHYAAGAFGSRCTDVIVWEAFDVAQYHEAVERLRDRAFFGAPLFEIVDVIAGIEDDDGDVETPSQALAAMRL